METACAVIAEVSELKPAADEYASRIEKIFMEHGAVKVDRAQSMEEAEALWAGRKSAFGAISRKKPLPIQMDPAIPVSKLAEYMDIIEELSIKHRLQIISFGHVAEGNLHPTVMTDERNKAELIRAYSAIDELMKKTIELEGTLTGEHGIGISKAKYLELELGKDAIEVMRAIKYALDPANILNPGKMMLGEESV